ncbi:MAG: phycobiliprotein lyase [Aphanocapsa feldmannii 277cV]|uniref:Chromophore lyase CpcS/CpeS n=2 Tax=Aphanocapsa feldmannii TaxID=192050 RepID=A0A524RR53_9CHRO|nr:MAG: phycobiliprotein lyase [Aphanocapsa feldmannii 277cV]TGH19937.1 MAG: phycobiliprotein lyase [Aphanocapsa feldmannii 277cI]
MREPADQLLTELGALPFADFLALQNGAWRSERTYFHLSPDDPTRQERERSTTTFQVRPLQPEGLARVMADNSYRLDPQLPSPCGFHLGFDTLNEFGETRSMQLNLLFVTTSDQGQLCRGDYLRDRAYEEDRPMVSSFGYVPDRRELTMVSHYSRVVSVDRITLLDRRTRIRRILNYARPATPEAPLLDLRLVGFGLELCA